MDKIASIQSRIAQSDKGLPYSYHIVSIWHNKKQYSANYTNTELIRIYCTNPTNYLEQSLRKSAQKTIINFVKSKNNLK